MTGQRRTRPTPHRFDIDLSPLEGIDLFGEPLELLFSAALRLQKGAERDGVMRMSATLPSEEADALLRAMARCEREVPDDRRTRPQRDADRLVIVLLRVAEVAHAVLNSQGAA